MLESSVYRPYVLASIDLHEQPQYASDVLSRDRALLTVHPDIVGRDIVQGAFDELGFSGSNEELTVQQD
jgi:hypothetical protein